MRVFVPADSRAKPAVLQQCNVLPWRKPLGARRAYLSADPGLVPRGRPVRLVRPSERFFVVTGTVCAAGRDPLGSGMRSAKKTAKIAATVPTSANGTDEASLGAACRPPGIGKAQAGQKLAVGSTRRLHSAHRGGPPPRYPGAFRRMG